MCFEYPRTDVELLPQSLRLVAPNSTAHAEARGGGGLGLLLLLLLRHHLLPRTVVLDRVGPHLARVRVRVRVRVRGRGRGRGRVRGRLRVRLQA